MVGHRITWILLIVFLLGCGQSIQEAARSAGIDDSEFKRLLRAGPTSLKFQRMKMQRVIDNFETENGKDVWDAMVELGIAKGEISKDFIGDPKDYPDFVIQKLEKQIEKFSSVLGYIEKNPNAVNDARSAHDDMIRSLKNNSGG